ncbi:MAG: rhamnogalacturonan acetylesterase [Spirochaetaceae bacterium]|nr:MAG: rhamnogalacturonan acetylesterase [Spirochaetaceae bacterium]
MFAAATLLLFVEAPGAQEAQKKITIYIAGDSTACNYAVQQAPRTGWGQVFQEYFKPEATVKNFAASGRSSRSFIAEKYLERIFAEIKPGDYLFIQFAHNDEKQTDPDRYAAPFTLFKETLTIYIDDARKTGANPVLLTPVNRRTFDSQGKVINSHGDYPRAIRELGEALKVPVLDMTEQTRILLEKAGPDGAKKIFLWTRESEYPYYPKGIADDTHFQLSGAREVCALMIEEIKTRVPALIPYLK